MRCSFHSSTRSVRWPFAELQVDDAGLVVRGRQGELRRIRWDEVERTVRCGFVVQDNVRVMPVDGPRFVVGGPKVVAEVLGHLPEHVSLRTERRRWFPWIPNELGRSGDGGGSR